ncbi:MAG: hypothetical protein Q9M40_08355 [Sulfurimonas sp.]|nr:hypothetical protein [Sulfurimonas sp.]
MTTWDDIAMDEAMSEINGIIDSDMEFEEIEEELFERGFVHSYDDAGELIMRRYSFLEKLEEERKNPPQELEVQVVKFEDIFFKNANESIQRKRSNIHATSKWSKDKKLTGTH